MKVKNNIFTPIEKGSFCIKNRIVMPPMDQYSAEDGFVNNWHKTHYLTRAIGGVGLIIIESTAVSGYESMITDYDLGLWDDKYIQGLKSIVDDCHIYGTAMGIQLNHAGRKCDSKLVNEIYAPSALAFNEKYRIPKELSEYEINQIIDDFKAAAVRAGKCGFDMVEIHGAHGYLISEFLSPLTNKRTDKYGKNRGLLLEEILKAVRSALGESIPISVRLSAYDWVENGNTPKDLIELIKPFINLIDILHISSGGVLAEGKIQSYNGYQIPFAKEFKDAFPNKIVIGGGLLWDSFTINEIIENNVVDCVFIGRELLRNPYWVLQASRELKIDIDFPKAYILAK